MDVLDMVQKRFSMARTALNELITHYDKLSTDARLEKSAVILDNVHTYIKIEENLILPFIEKSEQYPDMIDRLCGVHARIKYLIEHSIQMHVDEPNREYYNNMKELDSLLTLAHRVDEETIFPWARVYLGVSEQNRIEKYMDGQRAHETMPNPEEVIL